MRFQKGQSVVEFALVLPIFLVLCFGIFYMGMIFADYMTLSNIARSSAREASTIVVAADVNSDYQKVRDKYADTTLPLDAFEWKPKVKERFDIVYDKTKQNVTVTIHAPLNDQGKGFAHIFYKLTEHTGNDISLNITYTMYSEYIPKN